MKPILEHIANNNEQSLFFGTYDKISFSFPWHYHPQWELTFIIEGNGIAYTGNEVRYFTPKELVLIAPNIPHCWKSNASDAEHVKSIFVQWNNNYLGRDWLNKPEFITIKSMLESCHAGFKFILPNEHEELTNKIKQLKRLSSFKRMWLFTELLYEISLLDRTPIGFGGNLKENLPNSKRIKDILNYVNRHYTRVITAEDIASVANMAPVSFSKYFSRTFGKSFTKFLNEYRISQACSLLVATNKQVDQVADLVGYQNLSFFHRQFKLITGKTPQQFRLEYRN
ncbi:helix-turn-helix transcriptional regulator [Vibrio sp. SM6]|uniref:Helix-turn-helix transcriptional regulator n=1 Tax=Vibrio agarilyticus TaxID=2726741 RepID=A0A7X8YIB2_9VIBR|nr:AraC family transcriptional regulator [Vibrio agarilyticus]NLS14227.1 helix-turn-helix transcriptional regulator [Vibrio agarilyticus]